MVSSLSERCSHQSLITSVNAPPDKTISLLILDLIEFYGSIFTSTFDPPKPITVFFLNVSLTLLQSDSHIASVLTSSIAGWIVKGTPFFGLWRNILSISILEYIFDQNSPCQIYFLRDVMWIIQGVSIRCCSVETLLADICESKISTEIGAKEAEPMYISCS